VFTYASFNQIKSKHEMSAGNKQKNEWKIKRKFSEVVCVCVCADLISSNKVSQPQKVCKAKL